MEDYLDSFQGIVITVSHDRYFLDRMVRRIFAFEGNGEVVQYEGGFTDYQAAYAAKHPDQVPSGMGAGGKLGVNIGAGESLGGGKAGRGEGDAGAGNSPAGNGWKNGGNKKLKFSYKEQKEWDAIEDDIAALEEKIADLDAQMEAAASSYDKLNTLMAEKAGQEAILEEKMERWMYLNELAEKIATQET